MNATLTSYDTGNHTKRNVVLKAQCYLCVATCGIEEANGLDLLSCQFRIGMIFASRNSGAPLEGLVHTVGQGGPDEPVVRVLAWWPVAVMADVVAWAGEQDAAVDVFPRPPIDAQGATADLEPTVPSVAGQAHPVPASLGFAKVDVGPVAGYVIATDDPGVMGIAMDIPALIVPVAHAFAQSGVSAVFDAAGLCDEDRSLISCIAVVPESFIMHPAEHLVADSNGLIATLDRAWRSTGKRPLPVVKAAHPACQHLPRASFRGAGHRLHTSRQTICSQVKRF